VESDPREHPSFALPRAAHAVDSTRTRRLAGRVTKRAAYLLIVRYYQPARSGRTPLSGEARPVDHTATSRGRRLTLRQRPAHWPVLLPVTWFGRPSESPTCGAGVLPVQFRLP
jgi:hypothetical protein